MKRFQRVTLITAAVLTAITGLGGCTSLVEQLTATDKVTPIPEVIETEAPVEVDAAPVVESDHLALLRTLTIAEPVDNGDYHRTGQFGRAWLDLDDDGCDEREIVLARDLENPEFYYEDGWCTIGWGTLHDPYSADVVEFEKGETTSTYVQIDHIIPLKYAWIHGANTWSQETRIQFANDLNNLVATKQSENASKSARGPAEWIPQNQAYWCTYSQDFIEIAAGYGVSVSEADALQLEALLSTCTP